MLGCTFIRGRVAAATTEGGTTTRVAGQFTSYTSCPVRVASTGRVRITAPSSAASFAVVIYLDPDNANGGAGQPASGYVWDWRVSADERYSLYYDKSNARWNLAVVHSATTQNVTLADTFAAGDATALYVAADASTLYLAVDGGTIGAGTARTQQPAGLPTTMDIGSVAAATDFEGAYGAVVVCSAPLTQTQWQGLASLRAIRPPLFGEAGIGETMTGLWYGAQAVEWTLPTSGACIDLNDIAGANTYLTAPLFGTGVGPSIHRQDTSPFRDGDIYVDTKGAVRLVTATVMLASRTTYDALWALRRALAAAVNPRLGEGLLCYAPSTRAYEITAIVDGGGASFDDSMGPFVTLALLPFRCNGADWVESVRAEDDGTIPQGGVTIPLTIPLTVAQSAVDVTANNAGDVNVYPVVVFTAGSAGCTKPGIENTTTGKNFSMLSTYTMAAGEVLVVDMRERTIELNGANAMGSRDPDTEMWSLAPGDNALTASVAAGYGTVSVRHYPRFVGV